MADRGMGIRLFHTKDDLKDILLSFEEDSESETDEHSNDTTIVASQLRHFVIQVHPSFIHDQRTGVELFFFVRNIYKSLFFLTLRN